MIIIGNISEMLDSEVELYDGRKVRIDERHSIVINTKGKTWLNNLPQYAPSSKLYNYYLSEKKRFAWTREKFENEYLPEYVRAVVHQPVNFDKNKNIFLGCFCENESMCHRLLFGLYLQLLDYEVVSTSLDLNKYSNYAEKIKLIYREELNK